MPVMPTISPPSRSIRSISAAVSSRGPCVAAYVLLPAGAAVARPAPVRVVDDLVRHHQRPWREPGADAAHRSHRYDFLHLLGMQRPQVGAVVHRVWWYGVIGTVARKKHHRSPLHLAKNQRAGRLAVRRAYRLTPHHLQVCKLGKSAAADDC